ncbi:MAG: trimethylamine methyltransferase family protein [Verrucomicrobia bacterium]|nr:trimethylamine methyltransferase family protein [Verrucomicrobiota bacterium]MBU1856161.1 trimethylamine methyltransferase family protein [Verrucomicrobiota bacterium]
MKLNVLSDQEIRQIHEATVDILQNCGMQIGSEKMFMFLKEKGLEVDAEQKTVRFSKSCIEDYLSKIPPRFDVFDREGKFVFTLGDGVPKIAAGHNAVFWADANTGKTRPSTIADVELFGKICEQLSAIDMIGIPVMPQDGPHPAASLLYGVKAVIANSRKPVYFSTDQCNVNHACIAMLRAAFAGKLESQVYGISQLSPTSPLFWEGNVLEALTDTGGYGCAFGYSA